MLYVLNERANVHFALDNPGLKFDSMKTKWKEK